MKRIVFLLTILIGSNVWADLVCTYNTVGEETTQTCVNTVESSRVMDFDELKNSYLGTKDATEIQWARQVELLKAAESYLIANPNTARADYIINFLTNLRVSVDSWITKLEATKP